jgi:hypothetical protein
MGSKINYKRVCLVEGPGVKLKVDGTNLGAVRTNHPKISQLTLGAIIQQEFPAIEVRIVDIKSINPNRERFLKEVKYGNKRIEVYQVGQDFSRLEQDVI